MSVELLSSKPAGVEGVVHSVKAGPLALGVRVRLLPDGRWLVRIETADQAGGTADDPLGAFRIARQLAEQQALARGLSLPWSEIEDVLCATTAFNVDAPLDFSLPEWRALGLPITYPNLPQTSSIEGQLNSTAFVQQAFGVGHGPWQVVGARWDDYGRRMVVGLHFGQPERRM